MSTTSHNDFIQQLAAMPQRLTRAATAERLGVSLRTLEEWHKKGLPPKAVKHGVRGVRYLKHEVEAVLQQWDSTCS